MSGINQVLTSIAIIPARGGSKRLPRKNILPINNHPMIAYPVRVAIKSGLFDDVVVSTEDEEIAEIAIKYGATIIERPKKIAQDRSTVVEVCDHVLKQTQYTEVSSFCCIYPTAIFVTKEDLSKSNKVLNKTIAVDFVMGVSHYNYHPVQAMENVNGYLRSMWPEHKNKQSQFYPEVLVSNGTLYWAKTKQFKNEQSFYGKHLKGYISKAIDIDTSKDYQDALEYAKEANLTLL